MHHLLYCYRSRLNSYWCLKKNYRNTYRLEICLQFVRNKFFKVKKNAKKCFPDRLQFFWLCNRKQRPFFRPYSETLPTSVLAEL